jgi:hypothetical protein
LSDASPSQLRTSTLTPFNNACPPDSSSGQYKKKRGDISKRVFGLADETPPWPKKESSDAEGLPELLDSDSTTFELVSFIFSADSAERKEETENVKEDSRFSINRVEQRAQKHN